jgi:heme-degrading monooxygenase HmoA
MTDFSSALALRALAALLSSSALAATGAAVPPDAGATPVVAVVRVAKPWYAPRAAVAGKMRDTTAQYAQLPGLAFKAYSFERQSGDYGGLYYWHDAATARAWFNDAWFERVKRERGVEGRVAMFDAPLSIDNTPGGTRADSDSNNAVATLVLIATPAGVGRAQIEAEFVKAVPTYRAVPGLLRKHFIVADGGARFGGLYLWRDEASARAWFNAAWHERVRSSYGQPAAIDWFDTPILLPTRDAANLPAASAMMVAP